MHPRKKTALVRDQTKMLTGQSYATGMNHQCFILWHFFVNIPVLGGSFFRLNPLP
jgi:hypothetical protein